MGYCYTPRNHVSANSLAKVPDHLRDVDQHLVNWGIWSRDATKTNVCGSLESRYKPTEEDLAEILGDEKIPTINAQPKAKLTPDQRNALLIQRIVSNLPLVNSRLLLHYWYVHQSNVHFIRRKLKVWTDHELERMLNEARTLVKNSLKD